MDVGENPVVIMRRRIEGASCLWALTSGDGVLGGNAVVLDDAGNLVRGESARLGEWGEDAAFQARLERFRDAFAGGGHRRLPVRLVICTVTQAIRQSGNQASEPASYWKILQGGCILPCNESSLSFVSKNKIK
jgi:hypothetical protein